MKSVDLKLPHAHVSKGISKLGADIPSINLPPGKTCRMDAPCYDKCYARKGRFRFHRTQELLDFNLSVWENNPELYRRSVVQSAFCHKYFRWHSSGDIPNSEYLKMMIGIAEELPETRFLCFTKQYSIVNSYIKSHGLLPANLCIVYSAWGDFLPDNPNDLPVAYIRFKRSRVSIPEGAFQCKKYCGECVMEGSSCWDLRSGQSVVFDEH